MDILVTTGDSFQGKEITEYLGVVRGIVVRSPTITQGVLGGLKSIIGGNIGAYTEMCEHAREEAYQLMFEHASQVGANAVIAMRYDTCDIGAGGTEILCYGTAVRV